MGSFKQEFVHKNESILDLTYIENLFTKISCESIGFINNSELEEFLYTSYYPKLTKKQTKTISDHVFNHKKSYINLQDFFNFIVDNQYNIVAHIFYEFISDNLKVLKSPLLTNETIAYFNELFQKIIIDKEKIIKSTVSNDIITILLNDVIKDFFGNSTDNYLSNDLFSYFLNDKYHLEILELKTKKLIPNKINIWANKILLHKNVLYFYNSFLGAIYVLDTTIHNPSNENITLFIQNKKLENLKLIHISMDDNILFVNNQYFINIDTHKNIVKRKLPIYDAIFPNGIIEKEKNRFVNNKDLDYTSEFVSVNKDIIFIILEDRYIFIDLKANTELENKLFAKLVEDYAKGLTEKKKTETHVSFDKITDLVTYIEDSKFVVINSPQESNKKYIKNKWKIIPDKFKRGFFLFSEKGKINYVKLDDKNNVVEYKLHKYNLFPDSSKIFSQKSETEIFLLNINGILEFLNYKDPPTSLLYLNNNKCLHLPNYHNDLIEKYKSEFLEIIVPAINKYTSEIPIVIEYKVNYSNEETEKLLDIILKNINGIDVCNEDELWNHDTNYLNSLSIPILNYEKYNSENNLYGEVSIDEHNSYISKLIITDEIFDEKCVENIVNKLKKEKGCKKKNMNYIVLVKKLTTSNNEIIPSNIIFIEYVEKFDIHTISKKLNIDLYSDKDTQFIKEQLYDFDLITIQNSNLYIVPKEIIIETDNKILKIDVYSLDYYNIFTYLTNCIVRPSNKIVFH